MSRFVPNRGFQAMMNRSTWMRDVLEDTGDQVVREAKQLAPVDSGRYRDEIKRTDADRTPSVAVGSDVFYAHLLEWGTVDTPTYAVMQRAARAAGLTLRD